MHRPNWHHSRHFVCFHFYVYSLYLSFTPFTSPFRKKTRSNNTHSHIGTFLTYLLYRRTCRGIVLCVCSCKAIAINFSCRVCVPNTILSLSFSFALAGQPNRWLIVKATSPINCPDENISCAYLSSVSYSGRRKWANGRMVETVLGLCLSPTNRPTVGFSTEFLNFHHCAERCWVKYKHYSAQNIRTTER